MCITAKKTEKTKTASRIYSYFIWFSHSNLFLPPMMMETRALFMPLPQLRRSNMAPLTPISNSPKQLMHDDSKGQFASRLPRFEVELCTTEYIPPSPPSVAPQRNPESLQSWLQPRRRLNNDVLFAVLNCFVVKPFIARHMTAPEDED